jgi:AraC-like DNA-binding protein
MLISSLILSVIFSKRISDPVVSLLGLVDGWDGNSVLIGNTRKNKKESFITKNLYYVLRRVSDMSNDYKQFALRVHEYKDISRGIFINRLLNGEIISPDEIKMLEEDSILNFSYYTVAVARIISYENKSIDIAMFAVSQALAGMREKGLYFCRTAFDRFTIIICTNKFSEKSEITDVIESSLNKVNFDSLISLRWGVGDTVTNYDQISASYRNAEYALYNHDVLDSQVFGWYSSADVQKNRLTYNFNDAQRFFTLISNGDAEATIQAIKELVKKNKEVLEASKVQRNRFISMLSETILLSVSKFINLDSQLERDIERILTQMKRADSIDAIVKYISTAVEMLCISIDSRNKNNFQRIVEKIKTYIDDHYDDPNLSLISIAQSMRLTESYISSFFKHNLGINLHNYIEQKRMMKAAELLRGTELATTEIVEKIGYNNLNTFYKAFKRYYGITPKEYKLEGQF